MEEGKQEDSEGKDNQENKETGVSIDNNPDKGSVSEIKEKVQGNPWMAVSVVLVIAVIVLLIINFRGGITGNVISENDAGQRILDFANSQGVAAELIEVNKKGDFYEVAVLVNGQESILSVTKDGEYLAQLIPLSVVNTPPTGQQPTTVEYSEEDLFKINEFAQCLSDKGVKVYGANWCGYTKSFVKSFGGFDTMAPIYVECTENEELCSTKVDSGYPTTRINDEVYNGARTFEGLAQATGCPAPDVGEVQTSNEQASCD